MTTSIETYLHKALVDIEYSDFLAFYRRKLDESQTLEYKSGELLTGYKDTHLRNGKLDKTAAEEGFIKLATSIAGFANAQGGLFVLGVKELQVYDRHKQLIGKRPGAIYPVPNDHIQKEMIGDKLRQLIQFPLDNLTILPLRTTKRGKLCIYLIDVPASIRIPHRVNQGDYPQRVNFVTNPMAHYQINDLFYKRSAPDLDILYELKDFAEDAFKIRLILRNSGRASAKYPVCIASIQEGAYTINPNGAPNWSTQNPQVCQYAPGPQIVVHPPIPLDLGTLIIRSTTTPPSKSPVAIRCLTCGEEASAKEITINIDPSIPVIIDVKVVSPWVSPYLQ